MENPSEAKVTPDGKVEGQGSMPPTTPPTDTPSPTVSKAEFDKLQQQYSTLQGIVAKTNEDKKAKAEEDLKKQGEFQTLAEQKTKELEETIKQLKVLQEKETARNTALEESNQKKIEEFKTILSKESTEKQEAFDRLVKSSENMSPEEKSKFLKSTKTLLSQDNYDGNPAGLMKGNNQLPAGTDMLSKLKVLRNKK
jgi:hypothetical protein